MHEASVWLIAVKVIIGFISLYSILVITGRTAITQLTPFHFIFVLMLDDFLGHIIYQNKLNIMKYLYAVGLWTLLMVILQFVTMKYPKVRFRIQGKPIIIIRKGKLDRGAAKKAKMNVNQILSLLRQQSIFSIQEVEFGIIEPNGHLSVALKSKYEKPTMEDFHLPEKKIELPVTFIIDGAIIKDNLYENGLDETWLHSELKRKGYHEVERIFHAEWTESKGLHISLIQ